MNYLHWTLEEVNTLVKLFPITRTIKELQLRFPNRTRNSIGLKAFSLELKSGYFFNISKDELYSLYMDRELSSEEIAKIKGVTGGGVLYKLRKYGIQIRTPSESLLLRYKRIPPKKGAELPYYGKPLSEKHKASLSKGHEGRVVSQKQCLAISTGTKAAWDKLTPKEKAERMLPSLRSMNKRPNIIETKLDNLLQENFPKEWKYVGGGEITIGELIPDFINIDGKKEVLELFGNYWHDPETTTDWRRTELGRIMHYNSYGFKCLVIWENDFISNPNRVIEVIEKFSRGRLLF